MGKYYGELLQGRQQIDEEQVVRVRNLSVSFPTARGVYRAVRDFTLELDAGKFLAIVGESGSGKSVTARALLGLVEPPGYLEAEELTVAGSDLLAISPPELRSFRGRAAGMVFQDPAAAFDPVFTIGSQITESILEHRLAKKGEASKIVLDWLAQMGFAEPKRVFHSYPFELSGGMRQRAYIAMVMALSPRLIIADEPTTALDMLNKVRILDLLKKLQLQNGCTVILISHDLGMVASIADQVLVMYAGQVVEHSTAKKVLQDPWHPYTAALLGSTDWNRPRGSLQAIPGQPPALNALPDGCSFAPRCRLATAACFREPPVPDRIAGRMLRCHRARQQSGHSQEVYKVAPGI